MNKKQQAEFVKDVEKAIDSKIKASEARTLALIKTILKVPPKELVKKPANQTSIIENFRASFRGGKRENAKIILKDLSDLMVKHNITEIIYALRFKKT